MGMSEPVGKQVTAMVTDMVKNDSPAAETGMQFEVWDKDGMGQQVVHMFLIKDKELADKIRKVIADHAGPDMQQVMRDGG